MKLAIDKPVVVEFEQQLDKAVPASRKEQPLLPLHLAEGRRTTKKSIYSYAFIGIVLYTILIALGILTIVFCRFYRSGEDSGMAKNPPGTSTPAIPLGAAVVEEEEAVTYPLEFPCSASCSEARRRFFQYYNELLTRYEAGGSLSRG